MFRLKKGRHTGPRPGPRVVVAKMSGKLLKNEVDRSSQRVVGINSRESCIPIFATAQGGACRAKGDAFRGNAIHVGARYGARAREVFSSAVPRVFLRQVYLATWRMWIASAPPSRMITICLLPLTALACKHAFFLPRNKMYHL